MSSEASEKKCVKQTHNGVPPAEPEHLPCPRCESTNTKFCYYNNYNFSQPRHFCKACRRYWTHGGTLRDIPFGGGTRKNAKRSRIFVPPTNIISPSVPSYEYRGIPTSTIPLGGSMGVDHGIGSALPLVMDGKGGMSMCGSFTSLLNIQGFGPGVGPMGYGLGRAAWPFAGGGGDGGGGGMVGNTWQLDSCEGGFARGDCFSM